MVFALHHASALLGAVLTCAVLLHGKAWTRRHPRLAVALWHLLTLTCGLAAFGLPVSFALQAIGLGVVPALGALGRGQQSLRELTTIETAALGAALVVAATVVAVYAVSTLRSRRAQARHRLLLAVIAEPQLGAVTVIDHGAPLVYALPGREPHIVATTAAIQALSTSELEAVLAHERHHLSARHDLAVVPFAMLRRCFRASRTMAALGDEVDLLLEMCADDHAVRAGHRDGLVSSLDLFTRHDDTASPSKPGVDCGAAQGIAVRRARLESTPARTHLGIVLAGYVSALTFAAATLSLYALPF